MEEIKETNEKKYRFAKVIRILTVAPLMALIAFLLMWFINPNSFRDLYGLFTAIIFIVVFPLLAYPLQLILPSFKKEGRKGQRKLAIIMSVLGYIFGIILSFAFKMSDGTKIIFICYVVAGTLIFLFSKITPIKASGHACGVAGPVVYLCYFIGWYALFGLLLLGLVYVSSLYMKRHTIWELISGSLIPLVAFGSAYLFIVVL